MTDTREYPTLKPEHWTLLRELAADKEETFVRALKHFETIREGRGAELPDGTLSWLDTIVDNLTRRCAR